MHTIMQHRQVPINEESMVGDW